MSVKLADLLDLEAAPPGTCENWMNQWMPLHAAGSMVYTVVGSSIYLQLVASCSYVLSIVWKDRKLSFSRRCQLPCLRVFTFNCNHFASTSGR